MIMVRKDHNLLVVYLYECLIIANSKQECAKASDILIALHGSFMCCHKLVKTADPTPKIEFLYVELDLLSVSLHLPKKMIGYRKVGASDFS